MDDLRVAPESPSGPQADQHDWSLCACGHILLPDEYRRTQSFQITCDEK
ncbi:hypothetical protein MCM47_01720 [Kitasatospora sp. A2-31]|nr:hypothetical protein [Kitasatospora sp. A2-31]